MKKNYLIDHCNENERLNYQNKIDVYDLDKELSFFQWNKNHLILDAGCGNGNVIDKLVDNGIKNIHGIDFSEERVNEVRKKNSGQKTIEVFHGTLENTALKTESYDRIICRYVYEHLTNVADVTSELYRVLKPDGALYVIEFDNIFFDFYTKNDFFNHQLKTLKEKVPQDFGIARKLPQIFKRHHFPHVEWEAETFFFKGERLEMEYQNNKMRLEQGREHLSKYFKDLAEYDLFARTYLEEMKDECNVMCVTKYLITASKKAPKEAPKDKLTIIK